MNTQHSYYKLLLLLALFSGFFTSFGQEVNEGEKLFKTNCKSCHSIGKGKVVGPDLKDVANRRSEEWLIKFIKNPGDMIASDADAKKLFEEYDPVIMPNHSALTDQEIGSILTFIKTAGEAPVVEAKVPTTSQATSSSEDSNGSGSTSKVDSVLTVIIFVLLGGCLTLVSMLIYLIFKLKKS
ncbi:MAG: cytochrome c [Cytophagaceae bacterium]